MPWPKLIGGVLGVESAGLILWQAPFWWWRFDVTHGHIMFVEWFWLAVARPLLLLSYFIYHACDWARRTVIMLGICFGFLVILGCGMDALAGSRIYDAPTITLEMRIGQVFHVLGGVGLGLCILAPLGFVVCALCHRDVAAPFHRQINERSNQTSEVVRQ